MPVETIILVGAIVGAFTFYGVILAHASRQTDKLLRRKAKNI